MGAVLLMVVLVLLGALLIFMCFVVNDIDSGIAFLGGIFVLFIGLYVIPNEMETSDSDRPHAPIEIRNLNRNDEYVSFDVVDEPSLTEIVVLREAKYVNKDFVVYRDFYNTIYGVNYRVVYKVVENDDK
jgi:hypothetical protein